MYKDYHQEEHWNAHYSKKKYAILNYDGWLDKHHDLLNRNFKILDLGCGSGSDTKYLLDQGYDVTSLDFSDEALLILKDLVPNSHPIKSDITEPLPFSDNSFDAVIADLSLHYFDWETTVKIVNEISRILKKNGIIAARFNSDKDFSYGAGTGQEIEPGYFFVNGRTKRFFSEKDVEKLFSSWETITKNENITGRYGKVKAYWEYVAYNNKG